MDLKKLIYENRRNLLITLGVFVGCLLLLAIIMDQIVMPIFVHQGDECRVPDVINMSLATAEIKLEDTDLQATVAMEEFNADYPKGTVISQYPEPGASVKRNMRVRVTVSKGAASAVVPRLRGVSLREAQLMLEKEGLIAGDLLWFSDDVLPDGVIIESRPGEGSVMRPNAEVQLVVNRKDSDIKVKVPDFVGLDLSEGKRMAEASYLIFGEISYKVDARMLPETILYQSIPPGVEVSKWTIVNLTVSQTE